MGWSRCREDSGQHRQAPGLTRKRAPPQWGRCRAPGEPGRSRRGPSADAAPAARPEPGPQPPGVRSAADQAPAQEATLDGGEASSAEPAQRHFAQAPDSRGGFLRDAPTKAVWRAGSGAPEPLGATANRGDDGRRWVSEPSEVAVGALRLLGPPRRARVLVDKNNGGRWRWISEPFGTTIAEEAPGGLTPVALNLRFPGQYFDKDSGLSYNAFRDYDGTTGRYVQSDPVGLNGGINTYVYVTGSPLSKLDPNGLNPVAGGEEGLVGGTLICGPVCGAAGAVAGVGIGAWIGRDVVGPAVSRLRGPRAPVVIPPPESAAGAPMRSPNESDGNIYAAPPADAKDPKGPKAPGKPGTAEGFEDPKGGEDWVRNPNGRGYGWRDSKGNVWVPTNPGDLAHGGPHWDVELPGGGYVNVYPDGARR